MRTMRLSHFHLLQPSRNRARKTRLKFAKDAEDIETKAVFQLTAEAWTMLAAQVESGS
jgi:hypothetical protein